MEDLDTWDEMEGIDKIDQEAIVEATNLTQEQYQKFLQVLENIPSHRAPISGQTAVLLVKFMEDTGGRISEVIATRKKDLDFRTRIWTVINPKTSQRCKCSRWKYRDQYTRVKILDYADTKCTVCKGTGRYKKPQRTTFTPRLFHELLMHCESLGNDSLVFPVSRTRFYKWAKKAGIEAGINIFQQKKERLIEGIFLHLFRAMCSLRMTKDAKDDEYKDPLIACKLRHSFRFMHDRYAMIDINYLINWENRTYQ